MSGQSKIKPVRIRIKNFQSIEDIDLEVRGFTCITGPTNIGKSAIMRSISSAILNKPVGGMVRNGASFCSVEMHSESGWGFLWEKGDRGVNRCTIDGKTYDKIGRTQLAEVANMGFKSIDLGDRESHPWWANQFIPLFLLNETGQSVTDFISKVSRLTVLQDAISLSARGKLRANEDAKRKAEQAQKIRERLSKISNLEQVIQLKQELQEQAESISEYENKILLGQQYQDIILTSLSRIELLKSIEGVKTPSDTHAEDVARLVEMSSHYSKCESLAKRILIIRGAPKVAIPESFEEEYDRYKQSLRFEGLPKLRESVEAMQAVTSVKAPDVSAAEKALRKASEAQKHAEVISALKKAVDAFASDVNVPEALNFGDVKRMQELNVSLVQFKNDILKLNADAKKLQAELDQVESQLESIPTCDKCGRPAAKLIGHTHESHAHLS